MTTAISDAFNKAYEHLLTENDRLRKLKTEAEKEIEALNVTIKSLRILLREKELNHERDAR